MVYGALDVLKAKGEEKPSDIFETAIKNVGPVMEVRSRRIGGANYQVPREVRPELPRGACDALDYSRGTLKKGASDG